MRIYEIFNSIDGEVTCFPQGTLSTFIRLAGCNLNCEYCDTKYAQDLDSGEELGVYQIINEVEEIGCKKVTITGGEPLLQRVDILVLLVELKRRDYKVTVETNGTQTIPVDPYLADCWVVDYKTPCSGQEGIISFGNYRALRPVDIIKFVISDRTDWIYACDKIEALVNIGVKSKIAFSPVWDFSSAMLNKATISVLLQWMQEEGLWNALLNIQVHKLADLK